MAIQSAAVRIAMSLLLGFAAAQSAIAAFVTMDTSFGANSAVLDSQTGLEWLSLNETVGLTYSQVTSQLGSGQQFAGFETVTRQDVFTLLADAGLTDLGPAPVNDPAYVATAASFVDLFGGLTVTDAGASLGYTSAVRGVPFAPCICKPLRWLLHRRRRGAHRDRRSQRLGPRCRNLAHRDSGSRTVDLRPHARGLGDCGHPDPSQRDGQEPALGSFALGAS